MKSRRSSEPPRLAKEPTRLFTEEQWTKLRTLQSIIFDVDGVLTDDTIWLGAQGVELKRFHISDGLAIALLHKRLKIKTAIVSGRKSEATTVRANELNMSPCIQGQNDKRRGVQQVLKAHRVRAERAAFVGNEILDIAGFDAVGLGIAVADAAPEVAARADLVLKRKGGWGVARELFELICHARKVDYVSWF